MIEKFPGYAPNFVVMTRRGRVEMQLLIPGDEIYVGNGCYDKISKIIIIQCKYMDLCYNAATKNCLVMHEGTKTYIGDVCDDITIRENVEIYNFILAKSNTFHVSECDFFTMSFQLDDSYWHSKEFFNRFTKKDRILITNIYDKSGPVKIVIRSKRLKTQKLIGTK